MLKSRYFPVLLAFIVVVCGTGYILSPNGSHAVQGGIQQAIQYLPLYLVALVVGLAAGFIVSLLAGKAKKDKAFANGAVISFLIVALLGAFKGGWIHDNAPGWLTNIQSTIASWTGHTSHQSAPAPTPTVKHQESAPHESTPKATPHPSTSNQLESWTRSVAQQLPKKLDQYTQLSSVSYNQQHNTEVMRYDVDKFDSLGVDENQFVSSMRSNMLKLYCHGTFFHTLLAHKTGIYAAYHYHYGGVIGSPIEIRPSDCH